MKFPRKANIIFIFFKKLHSSKGHDVQYTQLVSDQLIMWLSVICQCPPVAGVAASTKRLVLPLTCWNGRRVAADTPVEAQ